jgi:hypothetical protein
MSPSKSRKNRKKRDRVDDLSKGIFSLQTEVDRYKDRIAFNFSFFDNNQKAGQDFKDWTEKQVKELLQKLKDFSMQNLQYWKMQGASRSRTLAVYGDFPGKSNFKHPSHVPKEVSWARFRLEGDSRLVGFIVDNDDCTKYGLCENLFYIVFLDEHHKFYLT